MSSRPTLVRPATPSEHGAAVELLGAAFEHDPAVSAATARAADGAVARCAIFRSSLAATLQEGGVVLVAVDGDAILGAAIVRDPARGHLSATIGRVRAALAFLPLLRILDLRAITQLNDADRASRRHAPREPHHVLIAVGVSASARGRGVGRALVEATVDRARADPGSWGVRLETENRGNVGRYERWGFDLISSVEVPPVTVHVMAQPTRCEKGADL